MPGFADYRPGEGRDAVEVAVRPGAAADVEAMARIQRLSGRAAHPDRYLRAVADADRCVVVAECAAADGPVVVGWGQTYHHTAVTDAAPTGHYLGGVTVDPTWRRRGVAQALTQARMEWIGARADEAFYVVNPGNLASIDLHRAWGFDEVLRAPRLTGVEFAGGTGMLMRASLPPPAAPAG